MKRAVAEMATGELMPASGEKVHSDDDNQRLADLLAELRELSRMRGHLVRTRVSLVNHIKSIERRLEAVSSLDAANPVPPNGDGSRNASIAALASMPLSQSLDIIDVAIKPLDKRMTAIVKSFPIYDWAKKQRGIGISQVIGLAQILAETGDLSNYATKERVWKRMGLACLDDGTRQRRIAGVSKAEAIAIGFVGWRRAIMAIIGENLLRAKNIKYRAIYEKRRDHTSKSHPDWTVMHSHRDGLRIMEKCFLEDLWKAWRAAVFKLKTGPCMPLAENILEKSPPSVMAVRRGASHTQEGFRIYEIPNEVSSADVPSAVSLVPANTNRVKHPGSVDH